MKFNRQLVFIMHCACAGHLLAQPGQMIRPKPIPSYAEFEAAMPPVRLLDHAMLVHGGFEGAGGQIMEPVILPNPKDKTRLIMFYAGQDLITTNGGKGSIGKAWAYKAKPTEWYPDKSNPILSPDPLVAFESFSVRLDSVLYQPKTDEYWIYYTGRTSKPGMVDAIGLAICKAGKDGYSQIIKANIKRYAGNPILSATGQGRNDGTYVSQGAVIDDHERYFMYYSYRNAEILPGVRLATSTDGKTWMKQANGNMLARGAPGEPDSRYFEWKQCFQAFGKYVLVWEAFDGKVWTICMASADKPEGPWTKSAKNPIFRPTSKKGTFDELFVATAGFYLIDGRWYLFYCGANNGGDYNFNTWDLGVAELRAP